MDLKALVATPDSVELPLVHPVTQDPLLNDVGEPMVLQVVGEDHDAVQKVVMANANARLKKQNFSRNGMTLNVEDIERESLLKTAAAITGWSGIQFGGEPLEYSKKNALDLVTNVKEVREQVEDFIKRRTNFLPQN